MLALVLSGGGLFGAWQAGAWSVLANHLQPDLIVGCSIGSVNGYLIACDAAPGELLNYWRDPHLGDFRKLQPNLRELTTHYQLRHPFALIATDLFRLTPRIYRDQEITWRHIAASCAVPLALPQVKIDGRWYSDGGLLNALPVWAALDLGATRVVALHVLAEFPSPILRPAARFFQSIFGGRTRLATLTGGVRTRAAQPSHPRSGPHTEQISAAQFSSTQILCPSRRLGSLRDTLVWDRARVEDWIELGIADATRFASTLRV